MKAEGQEKQAPSFSGRQGKLGDIEGPVVIARMMGRATVPGETRVHIAATASLSQTGAATVPDPHAKII